MLGSDRLCFSLSLEVPFGFASAFTASALSAYSNQGKTASFPRLASSANALNLSAYLWNQALPMYGFMFEQSSFQIPGMESHTCLEPTCIPEDAPFTLTDGIALALENEHIRRRNMFPYSFRGVTLHQSMLILPKLILVLSVYTKPFTMSLHHIFLSQPVSIYDWRRRPKYFRQP